MRGHGRSAMPESLDDYSSAIFAEDYKAVARAFGIEHPVFIGWYAVQTRSWNHNSRHCLLQESWRYFFLACRLFSYSWIPLATVVCDIADHLPKDTLAGVVYLAALPYIGTIMGRVGTSTVLGFLPGLFNTDDVNLSSKTTIDFVNSLFTDSKNVPFNLKTAWIGTAVLQSPKVCNNVLSRSQDPEKLHELGKEGLPMLILGGAEDRQVQNSVVVDEMKPYFKNLDVHIIEGGSHALFYDNEGEVVDSISSFVSKVYTSK